MMEELVRVFDLGQRDEERDADVASGQILRQTAGFPEPRPFSVEETALYAALNAVYWRGRQYRRRQIDKEEMND